MKTLTILLSAVGVLLLNFAAAQADEVVSTASADLATDKAVIASIYGGVEADDVRTTPVPGLYEIVVDGGVYYVSADGEYIINGTMLRISDDGQEDITEPRRQEVRRDLVNQVQESDMVVYTPKGETKYTITVFTDTSCYYCRELHKQMAGYNAVGIKVRYMAYPRRGPNSPDAKVMQSVWCADDKEAAMTTAKMQKPVEEKQCDAPINQQFMIGRQVGVTGTPAVVTEDGKLIPGYRPPAQLLSMLQEAAE